MTPESRDLALEALERFIERNGAALSALAASDYEPYESDKPFLIQLEEETQRLVDDL